MNEIEAIMLMLTLLQVIILPFLAMLIKDLQVFFVMYKKAREDGLITFQEYIEIVSQVGTILKMILAFWRYVHGYDQETIIRKE